MRSFQHSLSVNDEEMSFGVMRGNEEQHIVQLGDNTVTFVGIKKCFAWE